MQLFCRILFFLLLAFPGISQPRTDKAVLDILKQNNDPLFQEVLLHPEVYRYQVIYTRIDRDRKNQPSFQHFFLNVDSLAYFNPASTVKLPLAVLSLEKLNALKGFGIYQYTSMQFDSVRAGQQKLYADTTAENGYPSIGHFIRKALLVSDNDAYNRMYQFVGQQTINKRLHEVGLADARITRQFMGLSLEENRHTNPIRFVNNDGSLIWRQPAAYNPNPFDFSHINKMGKGFLNGKDSLVNEPFDFSFANNLTVPHLQQILQQVMFPASFAPGQQFGLSGADYNFLYRYLSQYPSESAYPKYDTSKFYDSYVKFFFRDSTRRMPDSVRVFNKVGWAYGCLTDLSYVADFENKVEFMLTATLYVNKDEILNDDKYEYEQIGWPFMYQLGQTIYKHELGRKRRHRPDLSEFRIRYEKRGGDERKVVREVDN